ncbi:cell division protein FtsW [Micrococcales bacterium 31B]|nr:cell division protein FtsW [Micrococcales bacterium 31B]
MASAKPLGERGDNPDALRRTPAASGRTGAAARRETDGSRWSTNPALNFYVLFLTTLVLVGFGLFMVLSASSVELIADEASPFARTIQQALLACVGLVGLVVTAFFIRTQLLFRLSYAVLACALLLQVLLLVPGLGLNINGNLNWLQVGPVSLQPAEFLKVALCMWLAFFFRTYYFRIERPILRWVEFALVAGLSLGSVLVISGDLGTGLVIMLILFSAMIYGGVRFKWMLLVAAAAAVLAVGFVVSSPNRMARIYATFTGSGGGNDLNYQVETGLQGLAQGAYFGLGIGESRQKWSYLPEAETDFIFAIIGEEGGLVMSLLVMVLYGLLAIAMHRVARQATSRYAKVATGTIMTWFMFQAVINISVVVGWMPVVGLPLPFISAGGSALLVSLLGMGVVLNFALNQPGARAEVYSVLRSATPKRWRRPNPVRLLRRRVRLDKFGRPVAPTTATDPNPGGAEASTPASSPSTPNAK